MDAPTVFPSSLPTPYASPLLSPRGRRGALDTCIRSQQAYDYAEEPADAGRSTDSLLDARDDALAHAEELVMGTLSPSAAVAPPPTRAPPASSPSPSPSVSPSRSPSAPSAAAELRTATRAAYGAGGGGGKGAAAALPAALRRAAGLVRGRSARSLWSGHP